MADCNEPKITIGLSLGSNPKIQVQANPNPKIFLKTKSAPNKIERINLKMKRKKITMHLCKFERESSLNILKNLSTNLFQTQN